MGCPSPLESCPCTSLVQGMWGSIFMCFVLLIDVLVAFAPSQPFPSALTSAQTTRSSSRILCTSVTDMSVFLSRMPTSSWRSSCTRCLKSSPSFSSNSRTSQRIRYEVIRRHIKCQKLTIYHRLSPTLTHSVIGIPPLTTIYKAPVLWSFPDSSMPRSFHLPRLDVLCPITGFFSLAPALRVSVLPCS